MKDPPSFSRLVDLRPVEPSRGPSLVKVNTNSRQCKPLVSLFPSLSRSTYIHIRVSLSLSRSQVDSKSTFFFHLEASTVLVSLSITSFSSPRTSDTIVLLSSPPAQLLFASSPSDRAKNYSFFPDSVCIEFIRHVRLFSFPLLPPGHRVSRCEINARPVTNVRSTEGRTYHLSM